MIIKTWTEPGPFRWEGKHFHFRYVNPWTSVFQMSIDELREAGGFVVGTPKEVVQRLKEIIKRLGVGHMLFEGQYGGLPHDLTMHSIELMSKEVLPVLRKELSQ